MGNARSEGGKMTFSYIFISCPNESVANKISNSLLNKKLIACASILPKMKSMYWWKGKIENESENFIILKTKDKNYFKIKNEVLKLHPNDVPEIIQIKISGGNEKYLKWIDEVVK